MKSLFVPRPLHHSSCLVPDLFFSPPPLLLFPSVVCCQPGPRRKSKLRRQMWAVRLQRWGGKERAASPPALPAAGGGAAWHTEPPSCWGHGGDACFCGRAAGTESLYFGEKTNSAIHLAQCRGGSGASKMFFATCSVTDQRQHLAWEISWCNSCRDAWI